MTTDAVPKPLAMLGSSAAVACESDACLVPALPESPESSK